MRYLIDSNECKKTGNLVVVVLGGASEVLEAHAERYVFCTSKRFGFFKLALQTGLVDQTKHVRKMMVFLRSDNFGDKVHFKTLEIKISIIGIDALDTKFRKLVM